MQPSVEFELSGIPMSLEFDADGRGVSIRVPGMGMKEMETGYDGVIFLEHIEGQLRLHVWSDINQADPTHTIEFEAAKESNRDL